MSGFRIACFLKAWIRRYWSAGMVEDLRYNRHVKRAGPACFTVRMRINFFIILAFRILDFNQD